MEAKKELERDLTRWEHIKAFQAQTVKSMEATLQKLTETLDVVKSHGKVLRAYRVKIQQLEQRVSKLEGK